MDKKRHADVHPQSDGEVHLDVVTDELFVNAAELIPGTPGSMLHLRILAARARFFAKGRYGAHNGGTGDVFCKEKAQGKLELFFTPVTNYPPLDALEVQQEPAASRQ